ncbi:SGPP2-like protein, partial [Mya arenaria]
YQHVADFQRLCGVEIATVEELTSNDNNGISNNVEKSTESNRPDHDAIKRNMSWGLGLFGALVWAGLVACSRVYLGMHTALDCIAGVGMTLVLLPPMLSVVEQVDFFQLTSPYAPIFLLLLPILACVYYPKPAVWSITRGDTSNIVSIGSLVCTVGWFHYQLGWMEETPHPPGLQPFPPITTDWLYYSAIRTVCGVIALAVSRVVSKKIWLKLVCNFAGVETKDTAKQREIGLEVPMRWFVIGGLAVNTAFTAPLVFHYFGINREYYYKEIGL